MAKILIAKNINASTRNKQILNNVSVELSAGELTCLCGPNGCGKSTLMSVLARLASRSFKLEFDEAPYIKNIIADTAAKKEQRIEYYYQRPLEVAKQIAYMQQNEYSVWDFSVQDYVLCGRYCHTKNGNYGPEDYEKVSNILAELELSELSERKIHSLSGGEFQKVRLARALVQEPDFLFLDEPANNLDFIYEPKLMALLKNLSVEKNIGILIIIHDVNLAARYADKIILLPEGKKPFYGPVSEVFTTENLEKTFGVKLQTYIHPVYNCIQVYEK